jgi:hypothetical protein
MGVAAQSGVTYGGLWQDRDGDDSDGDRVPDGFKLYVGMRFAG